MLIEPASADLEGFDCRISMASVASDGPFSFFPGVDRQLLILEGGGLELTFQDGRQLVLERLGVPLSFAGEEPIASRLLDGPVLDFNVMTRRGIEEQSLSYLQLMPGECIRDRQHAVMLFLLDATAVFTQEREEKILEAGRYDLLLLDAEESLVLRSDKPVKCILLKKK